MSLGARVVIAVFAVLFGALMVVAAPPTDKAPFFYIFACFCISIGVACVAPPRIAQFFGSLVSLGIIIMGIGYFVAMLYSGPIFTGRRGDQSLINSILFLSVFGIPSALYLWKARFGFSKQMPKNIPSEGDRGDA